MVVLEEEITCKIIAEFCVKARRKKMRDYQHLKHEIATSWAIGKVDMILLVIGTFRTIQVA